jgi:hypothetical protein
MTNIHYNCPSCGAPLPLGGIDVASDSALCRKCGGRASFSELCAADEIASAGAMEPPRGVRVESDLAGGGVTISFRRVDRDMWFLVPFTLLWGGGSIGMIYVSQFVKSTFDLKQSLQGLPFLFVTIFLICNVMFGLFGKHEIMLRRGEGVWFCGVGKIGRARRFSYSRDAKVALRPSDKYNFQKEIGDEIVVTSRRQKFAMCAKLPNASKPFIAGVLQREIARGS